MLRIAIKNAWARKRRLLSTGLSVVLGIAFLAGTLVFTDTIQRTFDDLFAKVYEGTETIVRSSEAIEMEFGGEQRGRISEDLLSLVRGVDGVDFAQGFVQGFAQVIDRDGDPIGNPGQGAPTFGMSWTGGELSPWRLTDGSRRPRAADEVVLDPHTAEEGGFEIGDRVMVLTQTGPHTFRLVGTARFGTADSPAGATIALFDLSTAQEIVGQPGELDEINVNAEPGIDERVLTRRIARVLPDGVEARTGTEITEETQDTIKDSLSFFNTFLLVFAAIGLIVAAFTIYNTFQIVVSQRTREMALLRALGGGRGQVLAVQLVEAVILGIVASAIGIAAGVLVASLLKAMLAGLGIDIPAGGTVFKSRTVIVSLLVGSIVTLVSAVFPSMRASRIAPLEVIRAEASEGASWSRARLVWGALLTVLGVAALVAGLAGSGIELVGLGALVIFIGVFVLGPLIARPVSRALGAPMARRGGAVGVLSRLNAMRNPKRTARTGGALMVGVALVVAITVLAASLKVWIRDVFSEQFTGDYVVSTDTFGFGGISTQLADDLNALPEVAAATGIRVGLADVEDTGDDIYISVDPDTVTQLFDIGVIRGDIRDLTDHGVFLHDEEALERGARVGDTIDFTFLDGTTRTLTVEGIYTENELAEKFVVSHALHEQTGVDQFDFSVYVQTARDADPDEARAAIARVSRDYPNADLKSREEYIDDQAAQIDTFVNLVYGLLLLAIIIALASIANAMGLAVFERTREIGMLRAVGMSRRQTRRMVLWESALVAMLGCLLGLVVGIFLGWSVSVAIREEGLFDVSVPVIPLVVIALLAVLGTMLFSIRPARRAAKLDVLVAISHQ